MSVFYEVCTVTGAVVLSFAVIWCLGLVVYWTLTRWPHGHWGRQKNTGIIRFYDGGTHQIEAAPRIRIKKCYGISSRHGVSWFFGLIRWERDFDPLN